MIKITAEQIALQYEYMRRVRLRALGGKCFVRTFGCQQNEADSEQLAGMAREMG